MNGAFATATSTPSRCAPCGPARRSPTASRVPPTATCRRTTGGRAAAAEDEVAAHEASPEAAPPGAAPGEAGPGPAASGTGEARGGASSVPPERPQAMPGSYPTGADAPALSFNDPSMDWTRDEDPFADLGPVDPDVPSGGSRPAGKPDKSR